MTSESVPFSQKVRADRLGDGEKHIVIEPDSGARERIAKAYDCLAVDRLHADLRLKPWRKAGVRVVGTIDAVLKQKCVVTLDSFEQEFSDPIDRTFEPVSSRPRRTRDINADGEIEIELESLDPPDVMLDGEIDLGALICEQLALNIDPFPRKPGAEFHQEPEGPEDTDEEKPSPFAALAELKQDPKQ